MKIGIVQNLVYRDKEKNLNNAERETRQAAAQGADIIVLGEMFNCPYDNQSFVDLDRKSTRLNSSHIH